MDWTDFAQRLTRELIHLPVDAFVILQGPGGSPYVQAMRYLNGLHAEAVSSDYLPEPLDSRQEARLAELGWRAPDGRARRNWWCRVMLPADISAITPEQAADCGALAARMASAFRDVYRVPSLADLSYEANRNGEQGGPVPMPGLGIAEVGERSRTADVPEWPEFAERLARELAALEPEMALVISRRDQESHYVQAFRDAKRVRAEAVSGRALPPGAPKFDSREEDRLAAAGWLPPGVHPNWTFDIPSGVGPDGWRGLAAMMVTALRDVQLARHPAELVYEAFLGASHIELTGFGIEAAVSDQVDLRRTSPPLREPVAPVQAPPPLPSKATPPPAEAPTKAVPTPEPPPAAAPPRPKPMQPLQPVQPGGGRSARPPAGGELEERLAAAKTRGDQPGYLGLILRAELFVPVEGGERPMTAEYRDGTYVLAFTSTEAMDWALGGKLMDYRRTTFTELVRNWRRPDWQLAINTKLPSSAYIDSGTIQRASQRARTSRRPSPEPSPQPARPPRAEPPLPLPHVQQPPRTEPQGPPQAPTPQSPHAAQPAQEPQRSQASQQPRNPTQGSPTPQQPQLPAPPEPQRSHRSQPPHETPQRPQRPHSPTPQPHVTQEPYSRKEPQPPSRTPHRPPEPHRPQQSPLPGAHESRPQGSRGAQGSHLRVVPDPPGAPVPRPGSGVEVGDGTVLQKVIRPDHVAHYLDGGYDWVGGTVHRLEDVGGMRTPEELVPALGLDYEGSPFSPWHREVYVIRWQVIRAGLVGADPSAGGTVPALRMGSRRLPHGAEMFRMDHLGAEAFVAVYDADLRGWHRTEGAGS
ncbi:TY-Chap domain-containing protein [Thermomonospora umbrina]|uniref:Type III secretion system (T3SS) SseB-like protein n=1 Tax=Thermomonospora umbrina TaxID=111806 RepID=A0A3D9SS95_9ACTN|nr:SseB family protein [Thermomonospora umbrina]REE95494.1 type III secretion system (T3SS) SseB-like protein [Thermomonospora umbrina]